MNAQRLIDVVKVLRELTPEERAGFNMGTFGEINSCNTIACAVGWYAKKRPEAGLYLRRGMSMLLPSDAEGDHNDDGIDDVLSRHFRISVYDVDFLFYPISYEFEGNDPKVISPDDVADRIEHFVRAHADATTTSGVRHGAAGERT